MNVLKLLFIVGSIFVANSLYGQSTIKRLKVLYQYEGEYYNDKNIPSVLRDNPESLELFRSYRDYKEGCYILSGVSVIGGGILWYNQIRKKDLSASQYLSTATMGLIITTLSAITAVSLSTQSDKKRRQAIHVFNTGVVTDMGSIYTPSLKLGAGHHGIGLVLQF